MADARLSILLSVDDSQAQAGLGKFLGNVNKTGEGVEKTTAKMSTNFQQLSSSVDRSLSALQSKVQSFGGGALSFQAPKIDFSSIKPIPPGVAESVSQFRDLTISSLKDVEKQFPVTFGSIAFALANFKERLKAATDPSDIIRLQAAITELSSKPLQLRVQAFGGGVKSFTPPPIIIPPVVIPPQSIASFKTLSDAAESSSQRTSNSLRAILNPIEILKSQLIRLQKIASLEGLSFKQYERINSLLVSTRGQLDRFTTGFKNIAPGANAANNALINVGRVFQDLPFGFLGVANNINPLIEGFQRASAAAKETGTSLSKNLLGALTGAGGLGFAFSIVTAAMQFAVLGLSGLSRGLFENKQKVEDDKAALDLLSASIQKVKDDTEALTTALQLANRLGSINVKIRTISTGKGELQDLREQSVAQQQQIVKLEGETNRARENSRKADELAAQKSTDKTKELADKALSSFKEAQKNEQTARDESRVIFRQIELQKLTDQKEINDKALEAQKKFVSETIAQGKKIAEVFEGRRVVPFFSDLDTLQEQFDKATQVIKDFKAGDLGIILKVPIQPEPEFAFQTGFVEKQLKDLKDREILPRFRNFIKEAADETGKLFVKDGFSKLKLDIKPTLQLDPRVEQLRSEGDELKKATDKLLELKGTIPPIPLEIPIDAKIKIINEAILQQQFTDTINKSISSLEVEGLSGVGEAIGEALAGGNLEGVFSNFANIIAEGLQSIGREFIKFGVIGVLAKKALKAFILKPELAIVAGIALVAAGAALKAAVGGGVKGFAEGGRPEPGKLSMITERGTEAFVSDAGKVTMLEGKGAQLFQTKVPGKIVPSYALGSIKEKYVTSTARITEKIFVTDVSRQLEKLVSSFKTATTNVFKDFRSADNYYSDSKVSTSDISKLVTHFKDKITTNDSILKVASYFKDVRSSDSRTDKSSNYATNESFAKVVNYFKEKTTESNYFSSKIADHFKDNVSTSSETFSKLGNYFKDKTSEFSKLITNNVDKSKETSGLSKIFTDRLRINDSASKDSFKEVLSSNTNSFKEFFSTASNLKQVISNYFSKDSDSKFMSESNRSVFNQIDKVLSKVISFDKESVLSSSVKEISVLKELFKQLIPNISNTSNNYSDRTSIFNHNVDSWFTKQGDFAHSLVSSSSALSNLSKILNQVIPHREFGGGVTAGNPFFVGENGQELFIPQASGTIIPKGNMSGLGGGIQNIVVEVIGRIAGDDIALSSARTAAKHGRLV